MARCRLEFSEKLLQTVSPLPPPVKGPIIREVGILAKGNSDSVLLTMLKVYISPMLAGLLAAGIISAVMGSDCHQILALSTMFTKDIFGYYGGNEKYGEKGNVLFARAFVLLATAVAYIVALNTPLSIFELAVRFAFSGF